MSVTPERERERERAGGRAAEQTHTASMPTLGEYVLDNTHTHTHNQLCGHSDFILAFTRLKCTNITSQIHLPRKTALCLLSAINSEGLRHYLASQESLIVSLLLNDGQICGCVIFIHKPCCFGWTRLSVFHFYFMFLFSSETNTSSIFYGLACKHDCTNKYMNPYKYGNIQRFVREH